MLHQLLNVAYVMQLEALILGEDGERKAAQWEDELHAPLGGGPAAARAGVSRVGPGVDQFMPLPAPPPVRAA